MNLLIILAALVALCLAPFIGVGAFTSIALLLSVFTIAGAVLPPTLFGFPFLIMKAREKRAAQAKLVLSALGIAFIIGVYVAQRSEPPDVLPGDFFQHCGAGHYKPC